MLKAKVDYDATLFADFVGAYEDALGELVVSAGDTAFNAIEKPLLDELGYTPSKVKYPIQWTSEKQRKAYFATDGFGAGIPYKRTGKSAKSWTIKGIKTKDGYRIAVSTSWDKAQFLYGTLNFRSQAEALKPMQQFHRNTGWIPVSKTVQFWIEASNEEFEKAFRNDISNFKVKRRSRR